MQERIAFAAIKFIEKSRPDLVQYMCGPTHGRCIQEFATHGIKASERDRDFEVQGFMTSQGRFVDRVEAYYIAQAADQIIEDDGSGTLYSENVRYVCYGQEPIS